MSLRNLMIRTLLRKSRINPLPLVATHNHYNKYGGYAHWHYGKYTSYALFSAVLVGSNSSDKKDDAPPAMQETKAGDKRPDLRTYRAEEVSKHNDKDSFWVIYRHGVYDVTSFLPSHPGGEQILNAGGLSIEPFWNVYGMHKTEEIYKLLESYRIGNLHDDDVADHTDEELWAREPARDRRLLVRTPRPFNAETPPHLLVDSFHTPNELFYVRQHMPVPELDPATHVLRVEVVDGKRSRTATFTMDELARMPQVTVNATLMCAGNRRSEMNEVKPVKGLSWTGGAIGTAAWGGVPLRELLLRCGVRDDDPDLDRKHVILRGADVDATGVQFSMSIPLRQALRAGARVLLAARMNGRALPPDHGRPLRALVPGAPAVRSVKWLESIVVSESESESHWHRADYRSLGAAAGPGDVPRAPPLYSLPVTAAACRPRDGDHVRVDNGCVRVEGYAYSGGGASIVRVELSADGGRRWTEAELRGDSAPAPEHYAWTLWSARVPVPRGADTAEIWVKATDSNFNTQPEKFDHIWNFRGLLSNAYHKIKIHLKH